ncbi:MAG: MBL fold metallo-hydrolase [Acidobacteria bacterium]|nr:MBL fold metallo-hydrolase [Acidobacteriota bacterium]
MRSARVTRLLPLLLAALLHTPAASSHAQSPTMDIYWIDVEGGGATLVIAPTGESMLVDTGWPRPEGRDARRIVETMREAGLEKLDYMLITHFHTDHVGSLAALDGMIPIDRFLDHGGETEERNQQWRDIYLEVAGDARMVAAAGDTMRLGDVDVKFISSNMELLDETLDGGGPNPHCDGAEHKPAASPENQRTLGALFSFGRFSFLNLGDLDWDMEMRLSCPVNRLGTVTLYQTSRHGAFDGAGAPAHLWAISPQVVVFNNGPRKGITAPHMYERAAAIPGVEGIWQTHLALESPGHNTAEDMIANFEDTDDCQAHWLRTSVSADGRFTVTNGRNGYSRTYTAR